MIRKSFHLTTLGALTCAFTLTAATDEKYAENWHQWRGPTANGVVQKGNPPLEWSDDKNIRWKVPVPGEGYSTPIIWEDRVFLMSAVPADPAADMRRSPGELEFTVFCFDREDGSLIWRKVVRKATPHESRHETNTYSSGSPVTDGEHLWVSFGSWGLHCLDFDGNVVWSKDLGLAKTRNEFGEASTPTLHDGTLFLVWDMEDDSAIHAFEAKTGEQLWKRDRDEPSGWTTPYVLEHDGVTQVVVNAAVAVRSYDVETGDLIWQCGGQTLNTIPTIVADDDTVYAMSGFRGNTAMAIELGHTGDLTNTDAVRWKIERGTPYVPSPLLHEGVLYFCQRNNGIVTAVDARTGETFYSQERLPGLSGIYASPVVSNDRIYLAGQEGSTLVLATGKELKILATNQLNDSFNASPAVVGDELFLRGRGHLYCIAAE